MSISIKKLHIELYYHPKWSKDKPTFIKFFYQSSFTNNDFIIFAKLYIKYSHIHCFQANELRKYFEYILKKMKIHNIKELFNKTHEFYQENKSIL